MNRLSSAPPLNAAHQWQPAATGIMTCAVCGIQVRAVGDASWTCREWYIEHQRRIQPHSSRAMTGSRRKRSAAPPDDAHQWQPLANGIMTCSVCGIRVRTIGDASWSCREWSMELRRRKLPFPKRA